jgi:hypothetical protein
MTTDRNQSLPADFVSPTFVAEEVSPASCSCTFTFAIHAESDGACARDDDHANHGWNCASEGYSRINVDLYRSRTELLTDKLLVSSSGLGVRSIDTSDPQKHAFNGFPCR